MRALGIDLPGLSRKSMWNRPYPPGVHGPKSARRRKMSDFKKQLLEKQKLRFNYGLNEGQFRRLYREAVHSKDPSGDKLVELLERRLDNFVFRAGFAPTIPSARQLVCHGHFLVNGKRLDIPSSASASAARISPLSPPPSKTCASRAPDGSSSTRAKRPLRSRASRK
jgi:small subunit ribosomal protein S4